MKFITSFLLIFFCAVSSFSDDSKLIKIVFKYDYKDKNDNNQALELIKIKESDKSHRTAYLVVNNQWKQKNSEKYFTTKETNYNGVLKKIPIYNFPIGLGSPIGAPIINKFKFNTQKNKFIVLLGNYDQGLSVTIFEKDNQGIFELSKDCYWATDLINHFIGKKSDFIISNDNIFIFTGSLKKSKNLINAKIEGNISYSTPLIFFAYQNCPLELSLLNYEYLNNYQQKALKYNKFINIKLNDEKIPQHEFEVFKNNIITQNLKSTKFNKFAIYKFVLARLEKDIFSKRVEKSAITKEDLKKSIDGFCNENNLNLDDIFGFINTKKKVINNKSILFKFKISNWVENNHRPYSEITVSEEEIKKFYNDYKWAFIKDQNSLKRQYYSLKEKHEFIKNEIKRLKYYRLDELLTNPPKVEIK